MSELDALLLRLKAADPVPPAGFEDGVLLAIGRIRAERRLSRALIPWETMIVIGALALGVLVGCLSQAERRGHATALDPVSPWIAQAPAILMLAAPGETTSYPPHDAQVRRPHNPQPTGWAPFDHSTRETI